MNFLKSILSFILLLILVQCTTVPNSYDSEKLINGILATEELEKAFLNNVREKQYFGKADIWGGGALDLEYVFDKKGTLWDNMLTVAPYKFYPLHAIVAIKSPSEAIVYMKSSASYTLSGTLYTLRITEDGIYRTKSAWGVSKISGRESSRNFPGWSLHDDSVKKDFESGNREKFIQKYWQEPESKIGSPTNNMYLPGFNPEG